MCIDQLIEYHRTSRIESVVEQVQQDAREGRKFNVVVRTASWMVENIPPSMADVATALIVFDACSESSIDRLDRHFRKARHAR